MWVVTINSEFSLPRLNCIAYTLCGALRGIPHKARVLPETLEGEDGLEAVVPSALWCVLNIGQVGRWVFCIKPLL